MRILAILTVVLPLTWIAGLGQILPQPVPENFPGGTLPLLMAKVQELEKVLANWTLACDGCADRLRWDDRKMAEFTAGRLTGLGFPSKLARAGTEWWVLVQIQAGGAELAVPVLPGVGPLGKEGCRGVYLGRIPWAAAGRFDLKYLAPEETLPLPANNPPRAAFRAHPFDPRPGEAVWFIDLSTDPDGGIVLHRWEFGDGATSTAASPDHVYTRAGTYTVTLTVVDDRGGVGTVSMVGIEVKTPSGANGGCGCGG